jgi:YVTN family beta-propeller protein
MARGRQLLEMEICAHRLAHSCGTFAIEAVTFIDTATNAVKHVTYVGRSPHEAFFTPDGKEVWVTVRGENYVAVLDGNTYEEKARITVPNGPGMQIFSPDGSYGYVCSSFTPETVVIAVANRRIVGRVRQASPFCPNIAATPDGKQVWFTLKDVGKAMVFDARPPFAVLKTIDTGPITNHVNFVRNAHGTFAYVTVGGLDEVQVFRTDNFSKVATIPVGRLPHGVWPSGDGTRVYVGLENDERLAAIDTSTNTVIASIPIGQAPQAVNYVPSAVPHGDGAEGLQPLGVAGQAVQISLVPVAQGQAEGPKISTSVALFDQGLLQVLQASVTGLEPQRPYVLALSPRPDGSGSLEPLAAFTTNPAGSAIVNALGPIRPSVRGENDVQRRAPVTPGAAERSAGLRRARARGPLRCFFRFHPGNCTIGGISPVCTSLTPVTSRATTAAVSRPAAPWSVTTPSLALTAIFNFRVLGWVASAISTRELSARSPTSDWATAVVVSSGRCRITVSRSTAASVVSVAVLMTTSYSEGSAMSMS